MACLIFDMTHTLQKFDPDEMWKQLGKMLLLSDATKLTELEEFKEIYKKYYLKYQIGLIKNDKEFFVQVFSSFGIKLKENELNKIKEFHLKCRKNFVSINPFVRPTLSRLKKNGHKLALLSNGVGNWAEYDWKMLRFNPKEFFKIIHYSQFTKTMKPNPKAFLGMLKKLNCKPEEAFMIGNNYEDDIIPAKALSMKTIYLNLQATKNNSKADYVIHSINEVLRIV